MTKNEICKYFEPANYCVCSSCKLDGKYTNCYGNEKKCKYGKKENVNDKERT